MGKVLIVVDMQNDFIYGSLANPAAQAIIKPIADYVKDFDGQIIFTFDTHHKNYLDTQEGKNLPIEHCIEGSWGWAIEKSIWESAGINHLKMIATKPTFGNPSWLTFNCLNNADEIILVGTCTDICVVSNALVLKTQYPETKISVIADLCAGLTPEKHEAALEVMRSCQIEVI